jgi:hydroxymethylbilane synthase
MLIIGSRGSALALAQANWVRNQIMNEGRLEASIKIIKTSADQDQKTSIRAGSATGVFVKEIEEALLSGEIDVAVHSMKDLPTRIPEALQISAIPPREDPRDALISRVSGSTLGDLPPGTLVGTGSVRRHAQLLAVRPDLQVMDIRGNVDTRLQKLKDGPYEAVILACAGLNRLGLQDRITERIPLQLMLPAPGQGALAIETHKDNAYAATIGGILNHPPTAAAVTAERAFLRRVGGGCNAPVAVHAAFDGDFLRIEALVAAPDGSSILRDCTTERPEHGEAAAIEMADKLLARGAKSILDRLA